MSEQKFYDTQPTGENHEVDYKDPTDVEEIEEAIKFGVIDPLTQKYALWVRTKMWRRHVRESIARISEYSSVLFNRIKEIAEKTEKRQTQVEQRQTKIEDQFRDVQQNATVDSEVINARNSDIYGKFPVLDDRLENIEQLLVKFLPVGFDVTINHELGLQPEINVRTWTHGIGVMKLGTEPEGLFGGSASQSIPSQVTHIDSRTSIISLPIDYKTDAKMIMLDDLHYLIIDEDNLRSIIFELRR
ncbi:hypothetical protein ACWOC1_07875 [Enterococcus quebecensis]|uniref:Baseplate upper protein immunoglobulin like domain-containing protein n=1 Tax=Enterococcus quebecensis TaxID=903983 RepID=A0A1E5GVQ9_9ENTE|nr:hypothetical protein [Enterococcus quebecensis]OEG16380.1 hypothetical protein BCR23_05680 [Enterococcus quebecensis]OJG72749.1 hypothetical protein RV12_GL000847 [Enterococcus quebecensis]